MEFSTQIAQQISARVRDEHNASIPWELLLELLLPLIENCFDDEPTFLRTAKEPALGTRIVLRWRARQLLSEYGYSRAARVAKDIECCTFEVCEGCEDDKLCAAYCECKAAVGPIGGCCDEEALANS